MDKKIYIEKYPRGEKSHKKVIREFRVDEECCGEERHERKERHEHHRYDERRPRFEEKRMRFEDKKSRHKVHVKPRMRNTLMKTKMFTSRAELVEYVNSIGDLGHKIDVFKIEEELYKVVVFEKVWNKESKEDNIEIKIKDAITKAENELEIEIEDDEDDEIELEIEVEED